MPISVRELAFKTLGEVMRKGGRSDELLAKKAEELSLLPQDKALLYELVLGTVQNYSLCDYYTEYFAARSIKKISPAVLDILRLSVYQITFLNKVPPSAAVNEGVKLAKKFANPAAASFVNAVLRKIAANKDNLPQVSAESYEKQLSILYSHPLWFVSYCVSRFGREGTEKLLACNNARPPIICRVNTIKTDTLGLINALAEKGISAQPHKQLENCIVLESGRNIAENFAIKSGLMRVQDAASQLAVLALAPEKEQNVIDMCAAPGGKTVLAAQLMQNNGQIQAFDISEAKAETIRNAARICGADIVSCEVGDATVFQPSLAETADKIICDVPCSGMGVIRKKPEIRLKTEESVQELTDIQQKIIKNASRYLKIGGEMVYSTCSVLKKENEDCVNRFLSENPNFKLKTFSLPITGETDGMITLLPHINGTDGFFMAKIQRIS